MKIFLNQIAKNPKLLKCFSTIKIKNYYEILNIPSNSDIE